MILKWKKYVIRYNSMDKKLSTDDNSACVNNVIFKSGGFFDDLKKDNKIKLLLLHNCDKPYILVNNSKCLGDSYKYYALPENIMYYYNDMPKISNKKKDELIQYMYDNIKIIDNAVKKEKTSYSFNEIDRKINNIRIIIDKYILLNQCFKMHNDDTICYYYQTDKLVIDKKEYEISNYFKDPDFIVLISFFLTTLDHDRWLSRYYNKYGCSYIPYFDYDKIETCKNMIATPQQQEEQINEDINTMFKNELID